MVDPGGQACAASCTQHYPPGTRVTLVAKPSPGSIFAGWAGGCKEGRTRCEVLAAGNIAVRARFSPQLCTDGWCWENPCHKATPCATSGACRRDRCWPLGTLAQSCSSTVRTGARRTAAPMRILLGVWGTTEEAWAVGQQGTTLRRDPRGTWTKVESGTTRTLQAVFGSGPGQAWAVGEAGTILRWAGGPGWLASPWLGRLPLRRVGRRDRRRLGGGAGGGDVAQDIRQGWVRAPSGLATSLTSVFGVGGSVYATTTSGIYTHAQNGWRKANSGPVLTGMLRLWASGPDDIWVAGAPIWHWNGRYWESFQIGDTIAAAIGGSGPTAYLQSASAAGSTIGKATGGPRAASATSLQEWKGSSTCVGFPTHANCGRALVATAAFSCWIFRPCCTGMEPPGACYRWRCPISSTSHRSGRSRRRIYG